MPNRIHGVLSAIEADITGLAISCIVNAANEELIMGGGVDGAIRRKAGPEMEVELRRIHRCPTGEAVLTHGHRLPAKYVIHTVAPIWGHGSREEVMRLLAGCYHNSLALAQEHGIIEVAFPCIGTGIYGWPADRAAGIAFDTVKNFVAAGSGFLRVIFCCFSATDRDRYTKLIAAG